MIVDALSTNFVITVPALIESVREKLAVILSANSELIVILIPLLVLNHLLLEKEASVN
jgi:hypothetical protein